MAASVNVVRHGGQDQLNFLILINVVEKGDLGHHLQPNNYCTAVVFVF
jgi:hypothetical protein